MPHVSIANNRFSATIDTHGAQLVSLKDTNSGEEYIWQRDPDFWAESAPICFPIVGNLKDGGYSHKGKYYKINKHGCVRYSSFEITAGSEDSVTLRMVANKDTLASYPFDFALTIGFTLSDAGLRVSYLVENRGDDVMPMSLGYHPAFALDPTTPPETYEIHFSEAETRDLYGVTPSGFGLRQENYLNQTDRIQLSASLFDEDALVFKNIKSQTISLVQNTTGWRLDLVTGRAPHLALWSKPGAHFVCIEPWYVCPDSTDAPDELTEKADMTLLGPGDSFESSYEVLPPPNSSAG